MKVFVTHDDIDRMDHADRLADQPVRCAHRNVTRQRNQCETKDKTKRRAGERRQSIFVRILNIHEGIQSISLVGAVLGLLRQRQQCLYPKFL